MSRSTTTQKYQVVSVDRIKPHPRNARQGNVDLIAESIEANDFYGACVVQRSSCRILAGTHRWKAAKKAGYKTVPVIWVDCDDDKALRILLADNRTSDVATYDPDKLVGVLDRLDKGELIGTGFTRKQVTDAKAWLAAMERVNAQTGGVDEFDNRYAINIECRSEAHQEKVYNRLRKMAKELDIEGCEFKVVAV